MVFEGFQGDLLGGGIRCAPGGQEAALGSGQVYGRLVGPSQEIRRQDREGGGDGLQPVQGDVRDIPVFVLVDVLLCGVGEAGQVLLRHAFCQAGGADFGTEILRHFCSPPG